MEKAGIYIKQFDVSKSGNEFIVVKNNPVLNFLWFPTTDGEVVFTVHYLDESFPFGDINVYYTDNGDRRHTQMLNIIPFAVQDYRIIMRNNRIIKDIPFPNILLKIKY